VPSKLDADFLSAVTVKAQTYMLYTSKYCGEHNLWCSIQLVNTHKYFLSLTILATTVHAIQSMNTIFSKNKFITYSKIMFKTFKIVIIIISETKVIKAYNLIIIANMVLFLALLKIVILPFLDNKNSEAVMSFWNTLWQDTFDRFTCPTLP